MQLVPDATNFGDSVQYVTVDYDPETKHVTVKCPPMDFEWEGPLRDAVEQGILSQRDDPTQAELEEIIVNELPDMLPDIAQGLAKRICAAFTAAKIKPIWTA